MDYKTIALGLIGFLFLVLFMLAKWDISNLHAEMKKEEGRYRAELKKQDEFCQNKIREISNEKIIIQKEVEAKKVVLEQNFNEKSSSSEYWQKLNDENRAYHVEKLNGLKAQVRDCFDLVMNEAEASLKNKRLKDASMYANMCVKLKPEDDSAQKLKKRVDTIRPVNKFGMAFLIIPKGEFKMGSIQSEKMRGPDEEWHRVTISSNFYLMESEVTQEQWDAVMNSPDGKIREATQIVSPSAEKGAKLPVENVSYNDINSFLAKINSMGIGQYRLPTEAEWEYAARANEKGPFGENEAPNATAWFLENAQKKSQPVCTKFPNNFGLYDMLGNVSEWVSDYYAPFTIEAVVDPAVTQNTGYRVYRGGSFKDSESSCRIANRNKAKDEFVSPHLGFRLVYQP